MGFYGTLGSASQAPEVGFCGGMIGSDAQGVLEIFPGGGGIAGTRFEDAEVVPSIGVGSVEAQSLSLFGDGLTQIASGFDHLREHGMYLRVIGSKTERFP